MIIALRAGIVGGRSNGEASWLPLGRVGGKNGRYNFSLLLLIFAAFKRLDFLFRSCLDLNWSLFVLCSIGTGFRFEQLGIDVECSLWV